MKNLLFAAMALVLFAFNGNAQSAKELSLDSEFIEVVKEYNVFTYSMYEKIHNNDLKKDDILSSLETVKEKKLTFQEELNEIDIIFKSEFSKTLIKHIKFHNDKIKSINRFQTINEETLAEAYSLVIINQPELQINFTASRCGWRYNLCLGAAFAATVLCHGGCDTTALATTAGLGIPVCVAACGTLQVFASVQCYDNYCGQK